MLKLFNDIHLEKTSNFGEILESTLTSLEKFMADITDENELKKKREFVTRPFLLDLFNNDVCLSDHLKKNEIHSKFVTDELVSWG